MRYDLLSIAYSTNVANLFTTDSEIKILDVLQYCEDCGNDDRLRSHRALFLNRAEFLSFDAKMKVVFHTHFHITLFAFTDLDWVTSPIGKNIKIYKINKFQSSAFSN